jgi:hypothetical protein
LRKTKSLFNIEIIGVNSYLANNDDANQLVSSMNTLPWLQDTSSNLVWNLWGVTWRDLRILDSSNRLAGVINLTSHDLADSENYETAKAMFLAAANGGDSNKNGLPDHWEIKYFGGSIADRDADPDGDGYSNFLEFAFGTDPLDPASHPVFQPSFSTSGQAMLTFKRWASPGLDYLVDASTNLAAWTSSATLIRGATTNLFDGTGRASATYTFVKPRSLQNTGIVRLKLQKHP